MLLLFLLLLFLLLASAYYRHQIPFFFLVSGLEVGVPEHDAQCFCSVINIRLSCMACISERSPSPSIFSSNRLHLLVSSCLLSLVAVFRVFSLPFLIQVLSESSPVFLYPWGEAFSVILFFLPMAAQLCLVSLIGLGWKRVFYCYSPTRENISNGLDPRLFPAFSSV